MEVLEENELKIMDNQKKEYEEVRNAELIEAQRFEAAEARVKAEQDRRRIQQRARKDQRRLAHQKHVSRVMSKKYLVGLRENAIQHLADMGLLHTKTECDLYQDVLPWLMAKRNEFMSSQEAQVDLAGGLIEEGVQCAKKAHFFTLRDVQKKKDDAIAAKIQAEVDTIARRENRALERVTRAKEQAKEQLRSEIRRILVEKSSTVSPAASVELLDIHGCYERGKQFAGSIGGMVMQWYHMLNAIDKIYPEESLLTFYARMQEDPN